MKSEFKLNLWIWLKMFTEQGEWDTEYPLSLGLESGNSGSTF